MNKKQRIGTCVALFLAGVVLFLHFPFYGYETLTFTMHAPTKPGCPSIGLADENTMRTTECQGTMTVDELPFTSWRSYGALVDWLAFPLNALITAALIIIIGGLWAWLFKPRQPSR